MERASMKRFWMMGPVPKATRIAVTTGIALLSVVAAFTLPAAEPPAAPGSPRAYREHAMAQEGNSERGKKLFSDARALCFQCHTVDGKPVKLGPDLQTVGDKYPRAELIRALLEPSATIMPGYGRTEIETKTGEKFDGILKSVSETELTLVNASLVTNRVQKSEVKTQRSSPISIMPEGVHSGLSLEEFTDLIAYLEVLKQPEMQLANAAGTPSVIKRLAQPVTIVPVHDDSIRFDKPIWFGEHPTLPNVFVVAEQITARVWLLGKRTGGDTKTLFADIRPEATTGEIEGVMSIAFHPQFATNRKFYLIHDLVEGGERAMVVTERIAVADGSVDSGTPSRRIIRIAATTEVHHGGGMVFGPDGFLYIGMGDTGPQEDPLGHGQDLHTLAAKILRIDVNRTEAGRNYAIPIDNPFASRPDPAVRREIWAYGLRQPWRFSFDPMTQDLWVGDVGQNRFEEVSIVRAGENHGWNVYEGFELFSNAFRKEKTPYVPPIVSFRRKHGVSVTGGYVYRARRESSFNGVYVCGDYESRQMWGITQSYGKLQTIREIGNSPAKIVSFGTDRKGELYIVGYDLGVIYKVDFAAAKFE